MKIDKERWMKAIITFIVGNLIFYLGYEYSKDIKLSLAILGSIIITLISIAILLININQENKAKIKAILGTIGIAILTISSGTFLGIKFNSIWGYLLAGLGVYILIRGVYKFRKKVFNTNENLKRELDKKLKKRYHN